MDRTTFAYELTGVGWGQASVCVGSSEITLTTSYLDDALGDLVRGTAALAAGTSEVRVFWAQEPGEYRWTMTREADRVEIVIRRFADFDQRTVPDAWGTTVFAAPCSVNSWCAAVASGTRQVLDTHGEAGYRTLWSAHDFPVDALTELEALTS